MLGGARSDTLIEVDLAQIAAEDCLGAANILHPVALDAAFHAMFDNIKRRAGVRHAFLPVRFASLRVQRDGVAPAHARVAIDRETDRSLSVSVTLTGQDGELVALLTGGLFRSVVLQRHAPAEIFFHQAAVRLSRLAPGSRRDCAMAALSQAGTVAQPVSWLYLGAFARALAFESLRAIHGRASILPPPAGGAPLLPALQHALLAGLVEAGLAERAGEGWRLAETSGLPGSADILRSFAAEHSEANVEILLAARAQASLEGVLRTGDPAPASPATLERFESDAILLAPVLEAAVAMCVALQRQIAPDRLRVLVGEPFCGGVLRRLSGMLQGGRLSLTVLGTDARRLSLLQARHDGPDGVVFLHEDDAPGLAFDVAFCLALGPLAADPALVPAIAGRLAEGAVLCILQPPPSLAYDCLLGLQAEWFVPALGRAAPAGRMAAARDGKVMATRAGLLDSRIHQLGGDISGQETGSLVIAHAAAQPAFREQPSADPVVLLQDWEALADALRLSGQQPLVLPGGSDTTGATHVFLARAGGQKDLAGCIEALAAVLAGLQGKAARLWVVVRGLQGSAVDPLAEAVWSFCRVAINEYPSIDLRLVDLAPGLNDADAARHLAALIGEPGAETELLVDTTGVSALRLRPGLPGRLPVEALRLQPGAQGALAAATWVPATRRVPEAGEIEVRIDAAGVNFRDIMLAGGLLNDDVLDDGMAGAVLGFEAAGHVLRVGDGVTHLIPGDRVMGFARESFATHATADARVFVAVPEAIATDAAATIPVAFLTAWYALVHVARIQPGEWVLIHGAAGGVGLAAMQIARLHGARIAATVGSPEKHALVAAFGAERIYNSRSTAFADDIRADIGGVDVVLNSLAGDAMQAGLKCLNPFGRFIELGKRDYVLNTALGLRPFRRNLSYFGVDLDQLLAANLGLVERLLATLAAHLADGTLTPLPYQAFDSHETGRAFQLMQSAGHVGKILIRPASEPTIALAAAAPQAFQPGEGAHLVVGGTGGFGFEAACWLAERGARVVVVASRKGQIEPALQARAAALRQAGIELRAVTLDVTDTGAVAALVAGIAVRHGRLAGVIHAAVVLEDSLITNLSPASTRAVLAPKVAGAANLDRATRTAPLDYFVAFSSVAAMLGNPGQASYVAANGYLQGLMAQRRAAGLPGLAVGWGAIADAGLLARDPAGAARLAASGIEPMDARAALAHLETLLAHPAAMPATLYCAGFQGGHAGRHLKLLQTPAFGIFAGQEAVAEAGTDLASRIAGRTEGDARALVAGLVAAEVGRIFRLPPGDIELGRPLDELGLDSMMSLDLRMSIEKRLGIELPVTVISAGVSVNELASRLIASLQPGQAPAEDTARQIMLRHGIGPAGMASAPARGVAVALA